MSAVDEGIRESVIKMKRGGEGFLVVSKEVARFGDCTNLSLMIMIRASKLKN